MTTRTDRACPHCAQLGDWDETLRHYHCTVCSTTWRRRPGRLIPAYTPRLPGLVVPIDPAENELPRMRTTDASHPLSNKVN
jgi:hypothetical protein